MRQSELFYKTLKETPKEVEAVSHKLLTRAGFIFQVASGIYNFLPLGYKVHKKIEKIIREEMDAVNAQEVFLSALLPKEFWQKTGRWEDMDPPLFKLKDRHKKEFALGSTHEEAITLLAKSKIESYQDLPFYLYQIQNKFRNEMRFTGGLLRTKEFVMKDLYSFHSDKKDLDRFFEKVAMAYKKIFKRCGLKAIKSEASGGVFTKEKNYEFQVLTEVGEDKILFCPHCQWAVNLEALNTNSQDRCLNCNNKLIKRNCIEVGHIFKLGTKYSEALGLYFKDKKGNQKPVEMGCYGIGLGRLMATVVEINHDKKGIIWPRELSPFQIHLIEIKSQSPKVKKMAEKVYNNLQKEKIEVLYDDRDDVSAGEKLIEADLIGIPLRVIISDKTLKNNSLEVKKRNEEKVCLIKFSHIFQVI